MRIRYVTLPSSNIRAGCYPRSTRRFAAAWGGEVKLVVISPETANAVRELGYPVAAEAAVFTEDGLIDAVIQLARSELGH